MQVLDESIQVRGRQILIHGLMLVMVGLVWGFVVQETPYPRLALTAHIQFIFNGILIITMAVVLLRIPLNAGPKTAGVMLLAAWLMWPMALAEVANAWWGTTKMLPIAAAQAGATGGAGWQELIVQATHAVAGIGLAAAWGALVAAALKKPAPAGTLSRSV